MKGGLLLVMLAGGSATIGYQDILGRMAHQPGVAERARLSILGGPVHTLKAATFVWPSASALMSGSAIPAPPVAALAVDVNRDGKADRLAPASIEPIDADPLDGTAGDMTPGNLAGAGTASLAGATTTAAFGMGTGSMDGTAGAGTDPYEDSDEADTTDMASVEANGLYSVPAGDPTGDPTQLEQAAQAMGAEGPFVDINVPGDGALAAMDEDEDEPGRSYYETDPELPLYRQNAFIFGLDQSALPPQPFLHLSPGAPSASAAPGDSGTTTAPKSDSGDAARLAEGPSPAERLGLSGKRRERAEKCLAEAVYFESRGEPRRGQIAVAQVVMNRVFSGYYPSDICRAVYQNAKRRFACQFTFACDNIRDVVTEPRLWDQAKEIASDMLDGRVWDEKVGRATHYHARSVRPNWIREMRKLDRIGEHTFYRPRRWTS
ncbi:cell wall hydrolase [Starkeya koreensis]|uniref:Cell wall hydrolase n=1 Tax=Ancylobacter koreensis TaxID=266121 RepID=A0ABT0DIW3_9HYPH|nr:cell wall hydrolase [Ancylobacter koreensis]MCK0207213.1 cell wall hydrolase [Ancylobacter koreensis]